MGTFASIKTEVATKIIDLPTAVQALIPSYVTRAVKKIQDKHNFKVMEALHEVSTTVATRNTGNLPANFKEYRGEPYMLRDDGSTWGLTLAFNTTSIYPAIDDQDDGQPLVLLDAIPTLETGVRALHVYPLPDGNSDFDDGEYRIKVPYWKYLTTLSGDSDTNWLTVHAEEYIIFQAAAEAFGDEHDEERMAVWLQRGKEKFDDAVMIDKKMRLSPVRVFVPHFQGSRDNKLRW